MSADLTTSTKRGSKARPAWGDAAGENSKARLRAYAAASADVVYRMSPDWSEMREFEGREFLADTREPSASWLEAYIDPADRDAVLAAIGHAVETKSMFELEHRVRQADGSLGWTLSRAVPILDDQGEIIEWIGSAKDVTDRRRADEAIRESEERYRRLFESMDEAYAVVEVLKDDAGNWTDFRFLDANPAFLEHTSMPYPVGKTATELLGTPNPRWTQLYGEVLDSGTPSRVEESEPSLGRIFDLNIFALDREHNRVAVLFTNITDRKRAEEIQGTLLAELQHRVRNILAMTRSVIRRTASTADDMEEYVSHLEGRIAAMARVQAILTRDPGAGVDLRGLLLDELEAEAASAEQYRLSGPEVELGPKAAEVLSLAIHELATNSVKYGALSEARSMISVQWSVESRLDQRWLRFQWREPFVGEFHQPIRKGFGTELIERRVPYELRGNGRILFDPDSVTASIEFPLADGRSILETGATQKAIP